MKREQRKARAIRAITVSNTLSQAAEVAGVTRRTLYNYLHDPEFVKELEKMYNGMLIEQVCDLEDQKKKAEDVLSELLNDNSPEIRLRAAKVVLDNARRREIAMLGIFLRQHEAEKNDPFDFFT